MEEIWFVGIDFGGIIIKLVFINMYGEIQYKWEVLIDKLGNIIMVMIVKVFDQKFEELNKLKWIVKWIGMGVFGFVEMVMGMVYEMINLGWKNYFLKDYFEVEMGILVVIENDVNIVVFGEMWKGVGDGVKDVILVMFGIGVGGGIIVNGEIVYGKNGVGGEIGYICSILEGGVLCNCGKFGCIEMIVLVIGIVCIVKEKFAVVFDFLFL